MPATRMLPFLATALLPTVALADTPDGGKTKLIFERTLTAEEFVQARQEVTAMLAMPEGALDFGDTPTWKEPPSYDLTASPFVDLSKAKPPSARDFPVRVRRSDEKPGALTLTIDCSAAPNRALATMSVADVQVRIGKKSYAKKDLRIVASESMVEGPNKEIAVQLPASAPRGDAKVKLTLVLDVPTSVRVDTLPADGKAPELPGFHLLANQKPNAIAYTYEKGRYANGIEVYALSTNGRRLAFLSLNAEDVGRPELLRKTFVESTFDSLPARVDWPPFAEQRVLKTFPTAPASLQIAVAGPHKQLRVALEGATDSSPLFHARAIASPRACAAKELEDLKVFAHRSVALASFGNPELSLLLPDCINFVSANFKLDDDATFAALDKKPLTAEAVGIQTSGYVAKGLAHTWYFEGDAAAKLGLVTGTLVVEAEELEPVTFERKVVHRDAASNHWVIKVEVPEGVESDPMLLLDSAGAVLESPSGSSTSGGADLTLTTDANLGGVDRVTFFKHHEKRTIRVPFSVDFATIPAPPRTVKP